MSYCPFCSPEPSRTWIEAEHAIAFADAHPVTDGHTLVIPRKHVTSIYELSAEEQSAGLATRKCFYCSQPIRGDGGHVDHFIPWSKYPIDLGHNFVLADSRCNGKKRDRMPHVDHLARWSERNRDHAGEIVAALKDQLPCDLACTNRIAQWAYSRTEAAHGLTWLRGDELLALSEEWRNYFKVAA